MMHVKGSFYGAGKSHRIAAIMHVTETGRITLSAEQAVREIVFPVCPISDLSISARLGNTPRYIEFPDGSSFETDDNIQIDELQQTFQQGRFSRWVHYLETHLALVLVMVMFVSIFVWASAKYGIPAVAEVTAEAMPAEVVQYLGRGTLDILDESLFSPSELDDNKKTQLTRLFESYIDDYPDINIKLGFRNGGRIGANALALPDGHIIFTDDLVELSENDEELLSILGHEIGHLERRHLLRRMIQDSMLTVLFVMITGDISSASGIVIALPAMLLELSYSREFETEADDFAYEFLLKHNLDTQHFANIMLRLMDEDSSEQLAGKDQSKDPAYFSTHPDTHDRIRRFISE